MPISECPHQGTDKKPLGKYLTPDGLRCVECLTNEDFSRYPGLRERLKKPRSQNSRKDAVKHQQSASLFPTD